jgi:hypothetical protein
MNDPSYPRVSAAGVVLRLALLAAGCAVAITLGSAAGRARETHIFAPACTRVCEAEGLRYAGTKQYRKTDAPRACECMSPQGLVERPAQFFSSVWVVEHAGRHLTSTLGLLFMTGALGFLGYVGVVSLRRRR